MWGREGSWAAAWERQRAAGGSQRLQERCLERLSAGRPRWALGLQCGDQKGTLGLHGPGIEPGPPAWQARILPLNHPCTGGRRRPTLPQRRRPPPARHGSPLARGHLSAPSEPETMGGRPEGQGPGTCRTPGRGALGGTPGRRAAGPLGPSRAFCADHGRRDAAGVARGDQEPTPSARRREPERRQALRGRRGRAPTFLSATCRVPTHSPSGRLAFRPGRGGACHCGPGPGPRARAVRDARAPERAAPGRAAAAPSGAQARRPKGG